MLCKAPSLSFLPVLKPLPFSSIQAKIQKDKGAKKIEKDGTT